MISTRTVIRYHKVSEWVTHWFTYNLNIWPHSSCCWGVRLWHPDQSVGQQDGAGLLQCPKWVQGVRFSERKVRSPTERRQYSVKMWNLTRQKGSPASYSSLFTQNISQPCSKAAGFTRMPTRRRESRDSLWRWLKRPGKMCRAWVTVLCFRVGMWFGDQTISVLNDQGESSGTAGLPPASPCPG